jgi:ubiquinone/menaquinone biosynthesis C-methylase UbiE
MNDNVCRICNTGNNTEEYSLKEMMFGLQDIFEYFKCSNCGCLQIKQIPDNIEKYYPANYLVYPEPKVNKVKKYLGQKREMSFLSGHGLVGKLLISLFGFNETDLIWFSEAHLKKNDHILEVGCGNGKLLFTLKEAGFKNLLGVDPFIQKDIVYSENFKIFKKEFHQIDDLLFDWVMFHHSFEHLENPKAVFEKLTRLLKPNGNVLIRIPLIDSYAWDIYGTDWVQLDPPRHYFLHSKKSIEYLSHSFNFKINKIVYDSTVFQFLGSEQYKKQIHLMSNESYFINSNNSIFNEEDLKLFNDKAKELNKNKTGDTACFFLQKMD